jgi:hypothetical protein
MRRGFFASVLSINFQSAKKRGSALQAQATHTLVSRSIQGFRANRSGFLVRGVVVKGIEDG